MLKMVDGTGIIGVDMVCPLGGAVSPPQPPNYDNVEMEGVGSLVLPNSLKAPLERLELIGNSTQGENPAPDNPQEIKSAGKWNEEKQKYEIDVKVTNSEQGWTEEQTLTLTSDRPLTKWDKLVEQGGQYGWLYGSDIKTFESDVFKLYSDNDKAIQYQVPFEEITNSWVESVCYCNTFKNVIGQTIYTQSDKTDFYMGCVHKSMVFSAKNKQGIFQSIEAFQEWIRNSGTYVWHKTDNKKFVQLSESEQTQLRNLHSYNGTTHITVDSGEVPCGIKLTYRKEK